MQTKTDHERAALCAALKAKSEDSDDLIVVKTSNVEIKAPTIDGLIPVVASTEDKDRDGDVIMAKGWDLKDFKKNPVIMWAHDYSLPPIGRAHNTRKEDGRLISDMQFASHDLNPMGDMVRRMFEQKFLNAVSVGFKPSKFEPLDDDSDDLFKGIRFLKQSLLEYSAVPIPSNPNALSGAKSAGINMAPLKDWTERVLDGESPARMWIPRDVVEEMRKAISGGRVFGLSPIEQRNPGPLDDTAGIVVDVQWSGEPQEPTREEVQQTIDDLKAEIARLKGEGGDDEENTDADADADASTESADAEPPAPDAVPQPEPEPQRLEARDILDVVRDGIKAMRDERDPLYAAAAKLHAVINGEENQNENAAAPQQGESQ
jgi:hypothetical protein